MEEAILRVTRALKPGWFVEIKVLTNRTCRGRLRTEGGWWDKAFYEGDISAIADKLIHAARETTPAIEPNVFTKAYITVSRFLDRLARIHGLR